MADLLPMLDVGAPLTRPEPTYVPPPPTHSLKTEETKPVKTDTYSAPGTSLKTLETHRPSAPPPPASAPSILDKEIGTVGSVMVDGAKVGVKIVGKMAGGMGPDGAMGAGLASYVASKPASIVVSEIYDDAGLAKGTWGNKLATTATTTVMGSVASSVATEGMVAGSTAAVIEGTLATFGVGLALAAGYGLGKGIEHGTKALTGRAASDYLAEDLGRRVDVCVPSKRPGFVFCPDR